MVGIGSGEAKSDCLLVRETQVVRYNLWSDKAVGCIYSEMDSYC